MSFSDLTFLFYFLPLFFAVYYILPFRFKNAALVLGSFAFYFIGAGARDTLLRSGGQRKLDKGERRPRQFAQIFQNKCSVLEVHCGHRSSASVTNICRRRSHGSAR